VPKLTGSDRALAQSWLSMRVLMTTKSGAGHFGPLIPFARALRRAGADVLIAAPREATPMVRSERLPLWAFDDPPAAERDALFAQARASAEPAAALVIGDIFARIDARAAYPGVLAACQVWRPDVVISEITEFAGPLAAEAIGVPSIAVGISQQGKEAQVTSAVVAAIDELRARFDLALDPEGRRFVDRPYLTLVPAALEDPATPASPHVQRFREPTEGLRAVLPDWWDGDPRPLVYVTFGSVAPTMEFFPDLYREAIDALASLPVRTLVTVGRHGDPADLGPLPAGVHVERWVAQKDVMPYASAMVCHGGSGTVTMALAAGVPMVVIPLFADQPWNAERIDALGAGIALQGGPDAIAGIGEAVDHLLAEPSYRTTAQRVAAQMRALPPVDAAVAVVHELLDSSLAA
jgi:UDP:flavonoid glycosyltransferase YjiC (YdhE family)